MSWIATWCVLLVTLGWLFARSARGRDGIAVVGALSCLALAGGQLAWRQRGARAAVLRNELAAQLPRSTGTGGYVSSDSCRACHPREHGSWHRSYHRTMTQEANASTILGRFDGTTLTHEGRGYRLERRGDTFWARVGGRRTSASPWSPARTTCRCTGPAVAAATRWSSFRSPG